MVLAKEMPIDDKTSACSSTMKSHHDRPPKAVFPLGGKKVTFEEECLVTEYEVDLTPEQRSSMWWEGYELDLFRFKRRRKCLDDEDDASETSSAQHHYSHSRQVLFHYEAFKRMDQGCDMLRDLSRQSSKQARDKAHKLAVILSKSNRTLDVSRTSAQPPYHKSQDQPNNVNNFNSRILDYYVESVFEVVENMWLCGGG